LYTHRKKDAGRVPCDHFPARPSRRRNRGKNRAKRHTTDLGVGTRNTIGEKEKRLANLTRQKVVTWGKQGKKH